MEDKLIERFKPVKMHFTSCSTSETHDSTDPPIILIHGLFASNSSWNRVKCHISNRIRRKVYSVDLRNHGNSKYTDDFTIDYLTADLNQFMKDEKIPRAILIGHSAGGRVAMQFALKKPEMVEKLVVEDISISDAREDTRVALSSFSKRVYQVVSKFPTTMSDADASKMMNHILKKYLPKFAANGEISNHMDRAIPFYKDEKTGQFKFHCNIEVIIKILDHMEDMRIDLRGDPVYEGKTLFIKGEQTVLPIEEDRELILKHFPRAQFESVKGAVHVTHTECSEEFARKVADFLLS